MDPTENPKKNPATCPHASMHEITFGNICDDCGLVFPGDVFLDELRWAVENNATPPCPVCGQDLSLVEDQGGVFVCGHCNNRTEYPKDIGKIILAIKDPSFKSRTFYPLVDRVRLLARCPYCEKDRLGRIAELAVKCLDCGLTIRRCPDGDDLVFEFFFSRK
ncbi:MAG: hypothetical protein PHW53_02710 [Patescibacteria group bacterium]|nr:hypothetical protein [Patescibacteria group bacterium]